MSTTIHERLTTPLRRAEAFDYVADFARQAEWDPNTISSRRIDEGALGVGARFALIVRMGRRDVPMEYRITHFEPPARVILVGEGEGVWSRDDIRFTVAAGGTAVEYIAEIRLTGLPGLLQPLLGPLIAKVGRRAADGMRRELDARSRLMTPGASA